MTVIESVSPGYKFFVELLTDRADMRITMKDLYSSNDVGQRVLIPVGRDRYDVLISIERETLGKESEQELIALAKSIPKTPIEKSAPYQIENEFYIFSVKKFLSHFRRGYSRYLSYNHLRYFWFFSMKWGKDQVMYRIRRMLSRLWESRATGIERACKKRGFLPYKGVALLVQTLHKAAESLSRYSRGIIYSNQRKENPEKYQSESEHLQRAGVALLNLTKSCFPKMDNFVRTLFAVEYPELCKPPPDM